MKKNSQEIILNGVLHQSSAKTLHELLEFEELSLVKVATAINGEFVPEKARKNTALKSGDRVEILTPRNGG